MILYIMQAVIVAIISLMIIWYYCHYSTPIYVRIFVYISMVVCCFCFILVPIDVYENSQQQSNQTILLLWKITYYINFFLCWIVLPMIQEYEDSGEFTFFKKIKQSLIVNGIIIGIICLGAICIAIYMIIANGFSISQIPSAFGTMVNVFGLLLVSIFLGYGLGGFPKQFYQKRDYKNRARRCHLEAQAVTVEKTNILQEIIQIKGVLEGKQFNGERMQLMTVRQLILENFPLTNFKSYAQNSEKYINASLASIHKIVKRRMLMFGSCESRLDQLVDELKNTTDSYNKNNYKKSVIFYTILFVVATTLSLIILWGQICTFFNFLHPLNILSFLDSSTSLSYMFNCLLLSYIVYLVVHSVFKIKIYRVFSLHKKHSASSSLTFTSINLSRICYPLCYNYVSIIGMPDTSFKQLFGQVNFSQEYAFVFPLLMVIFALINTFNVFDTVMGCLGLASYAFDNEEADEKSQEGKTILVQRFRQRNISNNNLLEMIQLL